MSFNRERRLLGRLGHGWETNSIIGLKETGWKDEDLINLAENKKQWQALMNSVMNLLVPYLEWLSNCCLLKKDFAPYSQSVSQPLSNIISDNNEEHKDWYLYRLVWRSIETCLFPHDVTRAVLDKRRAARRGEDFLVSWSRSTSTSSIFRYVHAHAHTHTHTPAL
jgi:hypothetical protein